MTQPTFIIDGYGFVFRAFHVQPPLSSPAGIPVGALYGFTSMLLKILSDFKPAAAVMVFDGSGKNHRHELYPEYKANRPEAPEELKIQFPLVRFAAQALNFTILEQPNVEADDVIATIVTKLAAQGKKSVVVSSDKDLMQLIGEHTSMYDPAKNKYIKETEVFEKFGVTPAKVRDVLALMGDSSDNIPGVPGIGPKTAAELLAQFGSFHEVLDRAGEIKQEKRRQSIQEAREKALLSWELVGLKTDLDIDTTKLHWTLPDRATLINFIAEYGFKSLIPRAEKLFGMDLEVRGTQLSMFSMGGQEENTLKLDPKISGNSEKLNSSTMEELLQEVRSTGIMAIYTEQGRLRVRSKSHSNLLDELTEELKTCLLDPAIKKITAGLKDLLKLLSSDLIRGSREVSEKISTSIVFDDLSLMHYAITAGNPQPSPDFFYSVNIFDKYTELKSQVIAMSAVKLYKEIDLPIASLLYKMERSGILIDKEMLESMSAEFAREISKLEQIIYDLCGQEFNIGSPKQLGEILFEKLKLPGAKISSKAKTYSTGIEILEHLSESGFEVADHLIRWRQITKLKNTYTDSLPKQIDTHTGRIHTNFIQNLTSTGRLSSNDPNLQNIPIRSEDGAKIRKAFIAKPGYKLISADYSQIELRLMSHVAKIDTMQDAFRRNVDIHAATASHVFKIPLEQMTAEYRRRAKAINFGIIYGISAFGLAKQLSISSKEAADYIASYFLAYPGIEQFMKETKEFAHKNGYVENIFRRRHYMPAINSGNYLMRNFAERAAINAPLQGSTADIAKIAMLAVDKALCEAGLDCQMLLQVHDELIFEVREGDAQAAMPLIKKIMEGVTKLEVPLVVDVGVGDSWSDIH